MAEQATTINPIQTHYNGYKFRSRLEARWAVFFDAAGIKYEYEPEGFQVEEYRYLPDFYLPQFDCYAEVKPSREQLLKDSAKISSMIDYEATPISKGLLILGKIPPPVKEGIYDFCFLYWDKGVVSDFGIVLPRIVRDAWCISEPELLTGAGAPLGKWVASAPELPHIPVNEELYHFCNLVLIWHNNMSFVMEDSWFQEMSDVFNHCLSCARQARFEHGETPKFDEQRTQEARR